jgi:hypothetical protein
MVGQVTIERAGVEGNTFAVPLGHQHLHQCCHEFERRDLRRFLSVRLCRKLGGRQRGA